MNDKLKYLSLMAGGSHYPVINPQLQQKFAELIIQECIEVIKQQESVPEGFLQPKPAYIYEMAIQQHFGIKQ